MPGAGLSAACLMLRCIEPLPARADEEKDLRLANVLNALDSIEMSADFMQSVMKNCQAQSCDDQALEKLWKQGLRPLSSRPSTSPRPL